MLHASVVLGTVVKNASNARGHEARSVACNHGTHNKPGKLLALAGCQWRQTAQLDANTAKVGETAQRKARNGRGLSQPTASSLHNHAA